MNFESRVYLGWRALARTSWNRMMNPHFPPLPLAIATAQPNDIPLPSDSANKTPPPIRPPSPPAREPVFAAAVSDIEVGIARGSALSDIKISDVPRPRHAVVQPSDLCPLRTHEHSQPPAYETPSVRKPNDNQLRTRPWRWRRGKTEEEKVRLLVFLRDLSRTPMIAHKCSLAAHNRPGRKETETKVKGKAICASPK